MKNFQSVFLVLLLSFTSAFAAVERRSLDLRLPTQSMMERQVVTAPGGSTSNSILSASAGNTSAAAATVTTFAGQPDVARNLVITPGGTTADVAACTVTVSGTDLAGSSISEDFVFTANQSSATTGSKAFKTVTSVAFPAACEDSPYTASWSIGRGFKLGLKKCMDNVAHFFQAGYGGVFESTRPTLAASSTVLSSNTMQLNTTLAGSDVTAFFVQNYRCNP